MKNFCLIATLFFCNTIFAQPVLTAADFTSGYTVGVYYATTNGFTNGLSGENQVWDYSSLVLTYDGYSFNSGPSPSCGSCFFSMSNYESFDSYASYDYFLLNEDSLKFIGQQHSSDINDFTQNPFVLFQFPFIYNNSFVDSHQSLDGTTQTITYDAYGTLIMPYKTFNNVIRKKIVSQNYTTYQWFQANPYLPILSGNFEQNTVVFIFKSVNLSTNQDRKDKPFSIYPNPTNGDFSIKNSNNFTNDITITVYDGIGKTIIKNQKIDTDFETISLKNFASGLYYVKISDKNNQLLHAEKIIKK